MLGIFCHPRGAEGTTKRPSATPSEPLTWSARWTARRPVRALRHSPRAGPGSWRRPPADHPLFFEAFEWATQTRSPMIVALSLEIVGRTVTTSDPDGAVPAARRRRAGIVKTQGLVLDEPDRAYDEHVSPGRSQARPAADQPELMGQRRTSASTRPCSWAAPSTE